MSKNKLHKNNLNKSIVHKGSVAENKSDSGVLYLVGTPIGNLSDMTFRAIETLKKVDFVAAEDTRVTIKLLNHYEIKNNLISYHEHSLPDKDEQILRRLLNGESGALVSDAGMPCISDPGQRLVRMARENYIKVTVVPGPCAAISSLVISGLDSSEFLFKGFLSTNKKNRLESLNELKNIKKTMIFYEAPHKLKKTLKDLLDAFGNRRISIVKELTKIHENVMLTTLEQAVENFENQDKIRGEYVLVLEGNNDTNNNNQVDDFDEGEISIQQAVLMVQDLCEEEKISLSEGIKRISLQTGHKKNLLYSLMHK